MKCFEGAISVKSGLCKGTYETRLCAESEKEVQDQMLAISKAMTDLNVQKDGLCNVTTVRENQRCRLPLARQEENEAIHTDCCRAPIPTCASDLDCTSCGLQSPACAPPLRCMATVKLPQGNETIERSVDCEPEEDACLSFSYFGCDGVVGDGSAGSEASCDNGREDEPFLRPEVHSCVCMFVCMCVCERVSVCVSLSLCLCMFGRHNGDGHGSSLGLDTGMDRESSHST